MCLTLFAGFHAVPLGLSVTGVLVNSLKDKVVAITGGGTGIGAGIARGLAELGCRVTIGGRRSEKLEQVASAIDSPHAVACHPLDVADEGSVQSFFNAVREKHGNVDILVNSAGVNIQKRTMADMSPTDWSRVLEINASGAYRCIYQVLPAMRARKDGLIVNISSVAGKRALTLGGVAYCSSKFAMTALGTAISNEVREEGVRVTNVYPGEVNTPILENRPTPVSQEHKDSILQPEDIASVVLTICALPPRANVPEVVVKPTKQEWM